MQGNTTTIDGDLLVFGGPYSNLEATQALLAEAARLAIPPERIICTGDLAAYCADPAATIDLVRGAGIQVVMGNCDEQLAVNATDCACGYPAGGACDRLASAWFAYASREVGAAARAWLATLPHRIDIVIGGARFAIIHGSASTINQFVFASTPANIKRRELDLAGADGIIGGHCGLPFTHTIGNRLWHNAGVLGMPANDGTPRVWFSLLRPTRRTLRIEHRALSYDHRAAAAKMRSAGLPPDYASALSTGIWPSCDVLPARERQARGVALQPETFEWKPERSHSRQDRRLSASAQSSKRQRAAQPAPPTTAALKDP